MKTINLDRRITLQREHQTGTDDLNAPIMVWRDIATVWAGFEPISDGERWRAREVMAEVTARFTIRWAPEIRDLNPKDRLIHETKTYDIAGVKEVGRHYMLEITAAARAD